MKEDLRKKRTIESKYNIGSRVCFIDNGALVYDNVCGINLYVYSDWSHQTYYSLEHSGKCKCEQDLCPADVKPQTCKTEEV